MDLAEQDQLTAALRAQASRLAQQEDLVTGLDRGVRGLAHSQEEFRTTVSAQVGLLSSQMEQILTLLSRNAAPEPKPSPAPPDLSTGPTPADTGARLAPPERYDGTIGGSRSFLTECEVHFEHSPRHFHTERSKVAFMMSHLTGRAKAWGTAEWARNSATCASSRQFSNALKLVFDPGATDRERARELSDIKQGSESVCDYAIRFRTMATESGWNTAALYDVFLKGLSDQIQDLMVPLDLPPELDSLIALAIRTDNRLQERRRKRVSRWTASVLGSPTARWNIEPQRTPPEPRFQRPLEGDEEPMQMGGTRLSREERERRYREGRCFYCGERGHLANVCYGRGNQRTRRSPI
uniref:CCHC-type domain-containing protein n=1 Tax=Gasterosteus aculeatus aculeatus TaxID=481459 RepID=A0AAQ4RCN5_GASAC